jgi:lipopolysaccharide export system permease protein
MPVTSRKRNEIIDANSPLKEALAFRYNFAFAGEEGRIYKATELNAAANEVRSLQIERKGTGPAYPTYLISARRAIFDSVTAQWTLYDGQMTIIADTNQTYGVTFQSMRDPHFRERPRDLMSREPDPREMRYAELSRYIASNERSGSNQDRNKVERALKIAVPFTCIIIALFGAPLATSNQRGGTAYGIAVSLATTVIFLLLVQLTKAIGGNGLIPPDYAAWIPGGIFAFIGLILLVRVRT